MRERLQRRSEAMELHCGPRGATWEQGDPGWDVGLAPSACGEASVPVAVDAIVVAPDALSVSYDST